GEGKLAMVVAGDILRTTTSCLSIRCCDPSRVEIAWRTLPGVSLALNPRLIDATPPESILVELAASYGELRKLRPDNSFGSRAGAIRVIQPLYCFATNHTFRKRTGLPWSCR